MSNETQAIFYGLALVAFVVAVLISVIQSDANNRVTSFNWVAAGLALWVTVPFVIALRAS